jgi:NTP pyrophosphatase (non-canonical NTP hydrolase)
MKHVQPWPGIAKLQEEMGELAAILGKLHAYPDGNHPDEEKNGPLVTRLIEELGDVQAALYFFIQASGINRVQVNARTTQKLITFNKWHAAEGMTGTKDRFR